VLTVDEDDPRWTDLPGQTSTGHPTADQDQGGRIILGDLRTIAIAPRSFDIVHCALLLDRIEHIELVLDRFTAALKRRAVFLRFRRDALFVGHASIGCKSFRRLPSPPPSRPEAKASGHPIPKPREWGSHTAAFRLVGKPAAPLLIAIQDGFIPWREGGVGDAFASALS